MQQYYQCPHGSSCSSSTQPQTPPMETPQPKRKKGRFWKCVGAIVLGGILFCAGGIAHFFSLDSEMRALILAKDRIQKDYYEQITDEQFYDAVFNGVNGLLDAYSGYLTPEEFMQMMVDATGQQIGVGVSFSTNATGEDVFRIVQVSGNSPAERAGIVAGERIVAYGASETVLESVSTYEAFSAFIKQYGEGENFYLRIRTPQGAERTVCVAREAYLASYVTYRTNASAYRFVDGDKVQAVKSGEALTVLNANTAYICLSSFNGMAADEFALAMAKFKEDGKKHLVLDLRGNTGGYLDIMLKIAGYLGKEAPYGSVAAVADYGERRESFCIAESWYTHYFQADSRVMVLGDDYTASASECLIGFMYDYGTIGYEDICLSQRNGVAKTYGKGIMQTTSPLILSGGAIKLTTARILWPTSHNCIHGRGVLPEDGALQVAENADLEEELKAAIATLFGR